ncbi:hypothetical protein EI94DRAFT_1706679 [Lactarius quietus]|nr:hypothetical protein EI94DRAFT_1706679 [Lactarius quietus]
MPNCFSIVWLSNRKAPATSSSSKRKHARSPTNSSTSTNKRSFEIILDDDADESGDDGAKSDGEDTDKRTDLEIDPEDEGKLVEDKQVLFDIDTSAVHKMFEQELKSAEWDAGANANKKSCLSSGVLKRAEWDSGANASNISGFRGGVDNPASSDDEDPNRGKETRSTNIFFFLSVSFFKPLVNERPIDSQRSLSGQNEMTPTPKPSRVRELPLSQKTDEVAKVLARTNKLECPSTVIKLSKQPDDLRAIIKVAISKVIGDTIHEQAYRTVDGLIAYYQRILWSSAKKSLHLLPFAKQFAEDLEFGKVFAWVVATGKAEGYYQLLAGRDCVLKVKALLENSTYIYPTKQGTQENTVIVMSKLFSHPAVIAVLREAFFAVTRVGSLANKHHDQFKLSLPDTHPKELEIPIPMLALRFVHAALEDYSSGIYKKSDFNANLYEDIYRSHAKFLDHIQKGSITKYHRLMADLYTQVSVEATLPRSGIVRDNAIAQLDLDGMDE